jgi:hypothetical protein
VVKIGIIVATMALIGFAGASLESANAAPRLKSGDTYSPSRITPCAAFTCVNNRARYCQRRHGKCHCRTTRRPC